MQKTCSNVKERVQDLVMEQMTANLTESHSDGSVMTSINYIVIKVNNIV
jgi:hypothetical protein